MNGQGTSSQIRSLRRRAGLSLSGLAKRVNTSPATLSRYERGWERFEVETLRKIADALGCRLRIDFVPAAQRSTPVSAETAVRKIKRLFWDHRLTKSDLSHHPVWIVGRVVEYGSLDDLHALIAVYGKRAFLRHVARCRITSPKAASLWRAVLEKEEIPCMRRSSQKAPRRS